MKKSLRKSRSRRRKKSLRKSTSKGRKKLRKSRSRRQKKSRRPRKYKMGMLTDLENLHYFIEGFVEAAREAAREKLEIQGMDIEDIAREQANQVGRHDFRELGRKKFNVWLRHIEKDRPFYDLGRRPSPRRDTRQRASFWPQGTPVTAFP